MVACIRKKRNTVDALLHCVCRPVISSGSCPCSAPTFPHPPPQLTNFLVEFFLAIYVPRWQWASRRVHSQWRHQLTRHRLALHHRARHQINGSVYCCVAIISSIFVGVPRWTATPTRFYPAILRDGRAACRGCRILAAASYCWTSDFYSSFLLLVMLMYRGNFSGGCMDALRHWSMDLLACGTICVDFSMSPLQNRRISP